MDLTKNLAGVESALTRIYGVMQKIEVAKKSIGSMVASLDAGLSQVADRAKANANAKSSTSNVMPTSLGNVPEYPARSSGGGGSQGGSGGGGGAAAGGAAVSASASGPTPLGRAASIAASAATFAWNITPGVNDYMSLQGGIFPTTFSATGQANRMDIGRRIGNAIGTGASSATDPAYAAAMASVRGVNFTSANNNLQNLLSASGSMYKVTGMSNVAAMGGLLNVYGGQSGISNKLMSVGINAFNSDGSFRDIGDIVYQVLQRSNISNMTEDDFNASLMSGFLGDNFNYLFGDDPALYAQAVSMARMQVKTSGATRGQGATRLRASDGSFERAGRKYGDLDNSPGSILGPMYSAQYDALVEGSEGGLQGAKVAAGLQTAMYSLEAALIRNTHALGDLLTGLKAGIQGTTRGITSNRGGEILGQGGTTHDNIPAILAHGEYVLNARAAKLIGRDALDKMNSLGQEFGAGFASPAPVFLSTGGQPDWTHPFPHSGWEISSGYLDPNRDDNHAAIDLNLRGERADEGKAVLAAASGTVIDVTHTDTSGGIVVLKHAGGYTSRYHHLSRKSITVGVGDSISSGQVIGRIGIHGRSDEYGTGSNSTGAHLHFSIQHNGKNIDPTGIVSGAPITGIPDDPSAPTNTDVGSLPPEIISALMSSSNSQPISVRGHRAADFSALQAFSLSGLGGAGGRMSKAAASTSVSPASSLNSQPSPVQDRNRGLLSGLGNLMSGSPLESIASGLLSLIGGAVSGAANLGSSAVDWLLGALGMKPDVEGETSSSGYRPVKGSLGNKELLDLLQKAGFRGERLREAWAIVMRESNGRPGAHNPRRSTRDNSYGLFQINMLGSLGPDRISKFGKYGLHENDDLFDPWVNAQVAAHMSQRGKNWEAWRGGPGYAPSDKRYLEYYRSFPEIARSAGLEGYSHGNEYVSRDQIARVHQGELIMPAQQAQMFREALQEVLSGARSGPKEVNITLNIERASDEEAERFARKVMRVMKNDEELERLARL